MSLIWTESFASFPRFEGAWSTEQRLVTEDALRAAGYAVYRSHDTIGDWRVVDDPVMPRRAGLAFRISGGTNHYIKVGRDIPTTFAPIIFGFSIFIPTSVADGADTHHFFNVEFNTTGAQAQAGSINLFSLDAAFNIRINGAIQSAFKPKKGLLNYFEVRVGDGQLRVWMNDALVGQRELDTLSGQIAFIIHGSNTFSIADVVLGNLYILAEDDIEPNVRLGPTTRVIGRRPSQDVRTMFGRPSVAFETNAEVVAQDLMRIPELTLQSETPGDTDLYAADEVSDIVTAPMIHAVGVKVYGANLDAEPHSLRPLIVSGEAEAGNDGPMAFDVLPRFTTANLNVVAERPDGGIAIAGNSGELWYSTSGGETWSKVEQLEEGINVPSSNIVSGVFSDNGNGIFINTDGTLLLCPAEGGIDQWKHGGSIGLTYRNQLSIDANGDLFWVRGWSSYSSGNHRKLTYPVGGEVALAGVVNGAFGSLVHAGDGVWYSTWTGTSTGSSAGVTRYLDDGASSSSVLSLGRARSIQAIAGGDIVMVYYYSYLNLTKTLYISRDRGTTWSSIGTGSRTSLKHSNGHFFFWHADNLSITTDGITWNTYNGVLGGNAISDILVTRSGRMIAVGANGLVAVTRPLPHTKHLAPLSGYQMMFNVAGRDPATGLPWVGGAASAAKFGMRVES